MHIAIIGGGAAGLMAAAAAQETTPAATISLIERNPSLGKKVIISGGGRCNVTTGLHDIRAVLSRYPRGGKFLSSAMRRFPPAWTIAWFEAHGVPLKTEEDLRVFPRSDDGKDVVAVFERLFRAPDSHVRPLLGRHAVAVAKTAHGFAVSFRSGAPLTADRLILTTGGQAYRQTGSTGDGYAFAESLGHRITPLAPSLNSFFSKETWPKELSGLSVPRAKLSAPGVLHAAYVGPFLFTHRGVSGPAVFALSALVAFERFDAAHPLPITIDLFPDEKAEALAARLAETFRANGKKSIKTVLGFLLPKALAAVLVAEVDVEGEEQAAQASKKDVTACVRWMKGMPLTVIGRGAGDEFVTAGGVDTDEVNPRTMESRICPGLFFAGEILNVDGFTGGFNLQASWATGRVAGENSAGVFP
ncbi:aminoacetone oxidase family FAD-binding enzyme [Patescibacteria group bacterium]|nr:MAG: aminoacetone oxidase family FAD-binding enzyme [Patescibacteria group bacterium]